MTDGENATHVLGQADFVSQLQQSTQNGLYYPEGISYDSVNNVLYVVDSQNSRVLTFDVTPGTMTDGENATHVLGQADFTSSSLNGGSSGPTQTGMNSPYDVTVDPGDDVLFVADLVDNRVLQFDTTSVSDDMSATGVLGEIDVSGNMLYTSKYDLGSYPFASAQGLSYPVGLAVDTVHHRLFVDDNNNNRVLVYGLNTYNILTNYTPIHVLGQSDFISNKSNQGNAQPTQASMSTPLSLAYDATNDRLFVGDSKNARVLVFNTATITDGMNAAYVIGEPDFVSNNVSGTESQSMFVVPTGLAYDSVQNRLYVLDQKGNRVLVFNLASGITNGMNAAHVLGQTDFISTNKNTTQSTFSFKEGPGLAFDPIHQRLFVVDDGNSRVLVFNTATITDGMNAVHVLGQPDFVTTNTTTDAHTLTTGFGAAYDPVNDQLFVVDGESGPFRALVFDTSNITDGENARGVLGQGDFVSTSSGVTQSTDAGFTHLAYNPTTNQLYVSDLHNNRVLIYDFVQPAAANLPAHTVGASYSQTIKTNNSQGTVTFAVTSGSLPNGLTLNATTGAITGTPTTAGTFPFTVTATDTNGAMGSFIGSTQYSITINALPVTTSQGITTFLIPSTPVIAQTTNASSATAPTTATTTTSGGSAITSTTAFLKNLSAGMNDTDVLRLEQYLNTHRYPVSLTGAGSLGNETMHFGPKTLAALKKLQKANGIAPVSGYFGPKTRAWVNAHLQ